jgi:phospholipid transport system substrate-binding protein
MTSRALSSAGLVLAILILLAHDRNGACAGEPLNTVKSATDRALLVLKDPELQPENRKKERIDRLKEIINPLFDYEETAKRALGIHWRRRSAAEQQEFVKIFSAFLEKIYSDHIDQYAGERIDFGREMIDGDYAEINGLIVSAKGEETPLIFKLRRVGEKWLVYDAVVENISIVQNYRSQFDRVIRTSSYEELVKRIRAKADL